jgi:hypothetical protein
MQLNTLQLNDKSITLEPGLPLLIGTVNGGRLHLFPDFVCTVDLFVGLSDALDVSNQRLVTLGTRAAQLGIALMGGMAPIA